MRYIIAALRWLYDFLAEDNLLMLGTIISLALLFLIVVLGGEYVAGPLFALAVIVVMFFSLRAEVQRKHKP